MAENEVVIRIRNVGKAFLENGMAKTVMDNVSIDVMKNEFLVILGSGKSCKSLLLDIIAGLQKDYAGEVKFTNCSNSGNIGIVFQKYALFPWKTLVQNVELGMKFKGVDKKTRRKRAMHYLDLVGLGTFENHYPSQISGGMKQRVAIARAYACESEVLLMDEPFGALDAQTRYQMEAEVLRLWEEDKRTILFVTNNIEEAIFLGDRIVLLGGEVSTVKKEYVVDLPRFRDTTDPAFLKLRGLIAEDFDLVL